MANRNQAQTAPAQAPVVRFSISHPAREYTDGRGQERTYWAHLPFSFFQNKDGSLTILPEHDITLKKGERYVLFTRTEE